MVPPVSARSLLFVPGDQPDKLARARARGADAVIVDLEDAVAPRRRDEALRLAADWLAAEDAGEGSEIWVRVSGAAEGPAQLDRLDRGPLAGVVVPKITAAGDLASIAERGIPVIAFIETAAAVLSAAAIAAIPGVSRLVIGEADLGAELGIAPSGADELFAPVRSHVVVASAAAGIAAPVGPVDPDFRDLGRFRETTTTLRDMGFGGRCCIHPAQVEAVNDVFTPSPDEVQWAAALVARFEGAAASGAGVIVGDDGTMVDEAYVRTARRLLERARRGGMA